MSFDNYDILIQCFIGFTYLTGKFTKTEDDIIYKTIDNYATIHKLSEAEIQTLITASRSAPETKDLLEAHKGFFTMITQALDLRPHTSVYAHVKRMFDPRARGGAWTEEESAALVAAVKQHGHSWSAIGEIVGRTGNDCRDRWRESEHKMTTLKPKNKKADSAKLKGGPWDEEETKELNRLVKKFGPDWNTVAISLKTRSAHQCRVKW